MLAQASCVNQLTLLIGTNDLMKDQIQPLNWVWYLFLGLMKGHRTQNKEDDQTLPCLLPLVPPSSPILN